ncbi:MAG TPA: type III polyketide synthase [Pirellulales bacterium]|nr:type III polyketide synthase [Pirellulales bacterium]
MQLTIYGLGTALPPHSMSQAQALDLATQASGADEQQARLMKALYRRSGVQMRYTCLPHEVGYDWFQVNGDEPHSDTRVATAGPTTHERMEHYRKQAPGLAIAAASEALERAEMSPRSITHVVTVSCTGFAAPGVDIALITRLGLPATTQRVHVGFMGCHASINALRVARGLAAADEQARVLLCSVELCSLHCRFDGEADELVSRAIFADGAGALVGGIEPIENSDPIDGQWRLADCASSLINDSTDAMSWHIGDNGFEMSLSARVPDLICETLRPWLTKWLAQHGLTIETIGSWAVHPGGPRVLSAVEAALELPPSAIAVSREVLSEHGNMSSATILFILDRLRQRGAPRPCVALAFGPGLMAEAALFV